MFDLEKHAELTARAKEAEWYESPDWAAERILDVELMTPAVVDPCAGRGVLGAAARGHGYRVHEFDLNDWPGRPESVQPDVDFLGLSARREVLGPIEGGEFTVFMNPPFSLTIEFIRRSLDFGARKIVMFQRLAFLESATRRGFFNKLPPARVWICGDRAVSWRGDIPEEDIRDADGQVICKGRAGRSTPTPHAWFIWERGHRGNMSMHHLYKEK
ncbi:MAG: hypothetical protein KI788_06360 [Mameliella sp.]|nr:hypothetical protein [Mameliella sp.]